MNKSAPYPELAAEILQAEENIDTASPSGYYETIQRGLPGKSFVSVSNYLDVSQDALASAIGIPTRTLYRRLESKSDLDSIQTEKVVRVARIAANAMLTFQDESKGITWLKRPNRSLSGKRPLDLLDNDAGAELVSDVLGRIREGIVA